MPSLSTKERKTKLCIAIKEFNDELLNVVKIQDRVIRGDEKNKRITSRIRM